MNFFFSDILWVLSWIACVQRASVLISRSRCASCFFDLTYLSLLLGGSSEAGAALSRLHLPTPPRLRLGLVCWFTNTQTQKQKTTKQKKTNHQQPTTKDDDPAQSLQRRALAR